MKTQNKPQLFIIVTLFELCMIFGFISTVYAVGSEEMVQSDSGIETVQAIAERAAAEPELNVTEAVATETAEFEVIEAQEVSSEEAEPELTETEEVVTEAAELEMTETEEVVTEAAELEMTETEEVVTEAAELDMTETEEVVTEAAELETAETEEVVTEEAELEMTETEEVVTEAAELETAETEEAEPEALVGKQLLDTQITAATEAINTLTTSVDELQKRAKLRGNQATKALNEYSETFFDDAVKAGVQLKDLKETYLKLNTNMDDHFNAWATKINTISNKKLRKTAEKRLKKGEATFAKVKQEMGEGDETSVEFSSNLQDITKYLSFDMTQSGVKEISGVLKSLVKQGKTIQKQLDKVTKLLNELPDLSDSKNL